MQTLVILNFQLNLNIFVYLKIQFTVYKILGLRVKIFNSDFFENFFQNKICGKASSFVNSGENAVYLK